MGSDKSNPTDLDIWGSPTKGKAECFHCGVPYDIETSSAPQDYAATYCSYQCYHDNMEQMHVKIRERQQEEGED